MTKKLEEKEKEDESVSNQDHTEALNAKINELTQANLSINDQNSKLLTKIEVMILLTLILGKKFFFTLNYLENF